MGRTQRRPTANRWMALGLMLAIRLYGDWPTYMHDPSRSAVSSESLAFPLARHWRYVPAQPPAPAWPEPGKELHRIDFDYAFQPIVAAGRLFIASSSDDTLRALDADTGVLEWSFTAEGPIRFAPSYSEGRIYLASDDGILVCLDAEDGAEVWRFQAAPASGRLLGNNRMISRWPCRSGALVVDDTVYCTAGMWPTEDVYVYALDSRNGGLKWCNDSSGTLYMDLPHPGAFGFSGVAPQGYLLVRDDVLLVSTGRCVPAAFNRHTGVLLYFRPAEALYHGGSWLASAPGVYFNARNRFQNPSHASIGEADPVFGDGLFVYGLASGDVKATLRGVIRALVDDGMLFGAGMGTLQAASLQDVLKAGKIAPAASAWKTPVSARVYSVIKAGDAVLLGCDGAIEAYSAHDGSKVWHAAAGGQVRGVAVADGSLFLATEEGVVERWAPAGSEAAETVVSERLPTAPPSKPLSLSVAEVLGATGISEGYALVTGQRNGRFAEALARGSNLHVICPLDVPDADLAIERRRLRRSGLYGRRVWVVSVEGGADPGFAPYFADVVLVSGGGSRLGASSCYRALRPYGGTMLLADMPEPDRRRFIEQAGIPAGEVQAQGERVVRGALPGAGEWRYPWADGGRTGVSNEERVRFPLELLWFGGPGPDRLVDRHLMGSPPVCANGRVFITGEHHVIAFDAYNGREIWCTHIPGVGRKYSQYYSSNMVADARSVIVATRAECLRLDRDTGRVQQTYRIPQEVISGTPAPVRTAYLDVEWPAEWHVAGPFPKGCPLPSSGQLATIPEELRLGETTRTPTVMHAVDGLLDFSLPFGAPGLDPVKALPDAGGGPRRMPKPLVHWAGQVAVCYAALECPQEGKLLVGAGADWWMKWYLDGEPVFDTFRGGNEPSRHNHWSRQTCTDADYLFDVDVSPGRHVLAAVIKSGSRGWALASASQAGNLDEVMPVVEGDDNVPNLRDLVWGYLSTVGDMILGSYAVPIAAGQPAESQLIRRSEGKALFALDSRTGTLRWVARPSPRRTISNIEIAFGDGRLFFLDATSKADSVRASRRGDKASVAIGLVALDLSSGRELWRQNDVPVLRDRSLPTRLKSNPSHLFMGLPNWGHLVYADGIVMLAANAAYDAETGKKLWDKAVRPQKLPIALGDWVISHPYAYRRESGEQRLSTDILTGETVPWRYDRAYGCGPVNGCRNVLFFRSGADGFFDLQAEGTTNFGGVRPNCTRSLVAAGGLIIHPEGYSGCCCSYNYQTSLALVPATRDKATWYVFGKQSSQGLIRRIALNFGAPGDRRGVSGTPWLGYPRPMVGNACPAPLRLLLDNAQSFHMTRFAGRIEGNATNPWLYSSGILGEGRLSVGLHFSPHRVLPRLPASAVVDGDLSEAVWRSAASIPFENTPLNMLGASIDFDVGLSSDALCFRFRRRPLSKALCSTPVSAATRAEDIQVFVTDRRRKAGIRMGMTRAGTRFATLGNVDRYRKPVPGWEGEWSGAVRETEGGWQAEIAVPIKTLQAARINPRQLQINAMARNLTDAGLQSVFLTDPLYGADFRRCVRFVRLDPATPQPKPERTFAVHLHFAETDETVGPGDRVFNVAVQGRTACRDLDIVKQAGGRFRPWVHTINGVTARNEISIELSRSGEARSAYPPLLCAVEVLEEEGE